jgi:hypothetical protein
MASNAYPLDAPLLPPLVLRPPLGPRLLRGLVMALAVLFHWVTAGWSVIHNGTEGEIAAAARLLAHQQRWGPIPPLTTPSGAEAATAPLLVWLEKMAISYLGATEFAVRLPTVLAVLAMVWWTMRLGERSGGIGRGCVAGMLLLCSPGMSLLARLATPAPWMAAGCVALFDALDAGARCHGMASQGGASRRSPRRSWYAQAWMAWGVLALAGGWRGALIPVLAVAGMTAMSHAARLRFRALISCEGGGAVLLGATVLAHGPGVASAAQEGWLRPAGALVLSALAGWFPWSFFCLPALRRVGGRRGGDFGVGGRREWDEMLPLAWLTAAGAVLLAAPMAMGGVLLWPPLAVWLAIRLETLPRRRMLAVLAVLIGCAVAALGGLVVVARLPQLLGVVVPSWRGWLGQVPAFFWPSVVPVALMAVLAFGLLTLGALIAEGQHRRRFAVLALLGAMIPAGYALADLAAKFAPSFSCADFARVIETRRGLGTRIGVDGPLAEASSLGFYLREPLPPMVPRMALAGPEGIGAESKAMQPPGAFWMVVRRERLAVVQAFTAQPLDTGFNSGLRIAGESGSLLLLTTSP